MLTQLSGHSPDHINPQPWFSSDDLPEGVVRVCSLGCVRHQLQQSLERPVYECAVRWPDCVIKGGLPKTLIPQCYPGLYFRSKGREMFSQALYTKESKLH